MSESAGSRAALSVVVPVREGLAEIASLLETMVPAATAAEAEVIVVGRLGADEKGPGGPVRLVPFPSIDMLALHKRGLEEARGEVVVLGEDHAVPRPEWWQAVLRAHAENPQAPVIAGCLYNATDATLAGRANFLAFAAPWQPPMSSLPGERPPPCSALSFKRWALEEVGSKPAGWLEAELIPSLFASGEMIADGRVIVDHYQDHGWLWSVRNAFHSARSSYGYEFSRLSSLQRRRVVRWAIRTIPGRQWRESRQRLEGAPDSALEAALIALISCAAGLGAVAGLTRGPGRSPDLLA